MKKMLIPVALIITLNLNAGTFYVNSNSPAAKDSNAGTSDSPWLTIQHGVDTVKPGDTVIVMPGSYDRTNIKRNGTKDAFITIKGSSIPSQKHVDKVKLFDPLKPLAFPGNSKENAVTKGFDFTGVSFFRIENFEITAVGAGKGGIFLKKSDSVEIVRNFLHDLNPAKGNYGGIRCDSQDCKNILIKDNILFRCPGTSINIMGENWIVEGNDVGRGTNCNTETGENVGGEDAIRPFGSGHIIRYNFIHDFLDSEQFPKSNPHLDAFQTFSVNPSSQYASNITIESNYCLNIGQMFMGSDTGNNGKNNIHHFTFKNNVFRGAHAYAIIPGRGCDYFTFVNNVVTESRYGGIIYSGGSHHAVVMNNIFYNNYNSAGARGGRSGQISIDESSKEGSVIDYNIQNFDYTYPKKDPAFNQHGLFVDPKFVDPEKGDYRLQEGSPAIDKGDPAFPVPEGGGKRIDIGAFEYGAKNTDWFLKYLQK